MVPRNEPLPPYVENRFAGLGGKRPRIEDAESIFIFDAESEQTFFQTADAWGFAVLDELLPFGRRDRYPPGQLTLQNPILNLQIEVSRQLFIRCIC
jgi:hypothetical protein